MMVFLGLSSLGLYASATPEISGRNCRMSGYPADTKFSIHGHHSLLQMTQNRFTLMSQNRLISRMFEPFPHEFLDGVFTRCFFLVFLRVTGNFP